MGSSTGNMLVDKEKALNEIFKHSEVIITTHCEDEETIKTNLKIAQEKYGENIPFNQHPIIRSEGMLQIIFLRNIISKRT